MFNNPYKSSYGQWNYNNNNGAMYNQQIMNMQGKENQVVKPAPSYAENKEEYVRICSTSHGRFKGRKSD